MKELKRYKLEKVEQEQYLVISKDYTRFDVILPGLSKELKEKNIKGSIILDLLLSNGNNSSRFYEVLFTGDLFDLNTLKSIKTPSPNIITKINSFIRKNQKLLYNSVLSNAEISRILSAIN